MAKHAQAVASFRISDDDHDLVELVVNRLVSMRAHYGQPMSAEQRKNLTMDVTACHANGSPLNLERLLDSNDFDFAHDIAQITRHVDRTTGRMPGWFHPRCNR